MTSLLQRSLSCVGPEQKFRFLLCDVSMGDDHHESEPSIEIKYSFNLEQMKGRSVDEIDGINSCNSDCSDRGITGQTDDQNPETINNKKKGKKSGRRVSFSPDLVSETHELGQISPDEKAKMFYTSKDLSRFRMEYIIELQEMHDRCKPGRRSRGGSIVRTFAAKLGDMAICKPFADLFCGYNQ